MLNFAHGDSGKRVFSRLACRVLPALFLCLQADAPAQTARVTRESAPMGVKEFIAEVESVSPRSGRGAYPQVTWEWLTRYFDPYTRFDVQTIALNYFTTDAAGVEIPVSGLCIVPVTPPGTVNTSSVPVFSMQHPTQVERRYSPSVCGAQDPQLTVQVSALIAASGYIVVLADYPGMGINTNAHPYCHLSLGNSVVDMIKTGLAHTRETAATNAAYPAWDGRLFMMGYSEGGYATLAAAKKIQEDAGELTATAVAPLAGPHSLSDTMRSVMLCAGAEYPSPYFLPYVLNGYDSVYAAAHPAFAFANAVKKEVPDEPEFARKLQHMAMAGTNTASEINALIYKAVPYAGPRSILTDAFLAGLSDTAGPVCSTLESNNSYADWTPGMPVRLMHNLDDELVPSGNSTNAYNAFIARGAGRVELDVFSSWNYPLIYVLYQEMGSYHSATAPFAYIRGFDWLDSMAYPDRNTGDDPRHFDRDGDLVADPAVYWPQGGKWYILCSSLPMAFEEAWGWSETPPVPGDYDGDGISDLAVYWPAAGAWFTFQSSTETMLRIDWGWNETIPAPGDYDGDGRTDPAVYWPATGAWFILQSSIGTTRTVYWGWRETVPVPADYDGDGSADPAVYWPATGAWFILQSSSGTMRTVYWGWSETAPVPADYDGDGLADPAVYWPAAGAWFIPQSSSGTMRRVDWGWSEAAPAPDDFDGDGLADPTVYWPATGAWFILQSSSGTMRRVDWGWSEAAPVDNQLRINKAYFPLP